MLLVEKRVHGVVNVRVFVPQWRYESTMWQETYENLHESVVRKLLRGFVPAPLQVFCVNVKYRMLNMLQIRMLQIAQSA